MGVLVESRILNEESSAVARAVLFPELAPVGAKYSLDGESD
jgi:hypothetical protein